MKYVRIVRGNRLRLCLALKCGNLLPKMIEHCIRWRVPVVRPPVHFTAGNDVDAGDFLLQNGRLARPQLGVGEIPRAIWPAVTSRSNASYHRGTL